MSKLLFSYEKDMPTVTMIRDYIAVFAKKYGSEVRFRQLKQITREDIDWCDVVEFIRPHDPYSVWLAQRARLAGCYVIAYYDDDLYELPESMPNPSWRKNSVRRALEHADIILSSSPHICKKYAPHTRAQKGVVTHTAVDAGEIKRILPLEEKPDETRKVKLIYAANPGHVGFFDTFIRPIMPQLCEHYADKISMTFMSVRPDLSEYESKMEIRYVPGMPLAEYRQKIQEGNYDIGLSPLTTNEFTKCKYFNKFIEYTMAGIVGVYSNTEPYTYVVEDGKNGFLASDDPQDWYRCLSRAIDDAFLRNQCVCAAQQLLITDFSPEGVMDSNAQNVPQMVNAHKNAKPCKSLAWFGVIYRLIRLMDRAYQVLFYLKHTGLSGLIEKIQVHFREGKAYK